MSFFTSGLSESDKEVFDIINLEAKRQQNHIEMIASENIVSKAVLEAVGSILTNKYAEGYPGRRYYNGCEEVDKIEELGRARARKLFNCEYVNLQPSSGSQANQAVYLAFLQPGDKVLSMSLDAGGHLTHGAAKNMSGLWFDIIGYGVNDEGLVDYSEVEKLALEHKPKMIIAGYSAYPRELDWSKFREIANKVGAILMVDMAHVAGLVAAGEFLSPIPFADVVTTTTHKTLRGARGGMILAKDLTHEKKLNSAVFPGLQGGPLMHAIAGKTVALGEALRPEFKEYIIQVKKNAKALASTLMEGGLDILTGGTDNHMVIVDIKKYSSVNPNINGKIFSNALAQIGIIANMNGVPNDPLPPMKTSGVRLGTPAGTTRGFKEKEFEILGQIICDVFKNLVENDGVLDEGIVGDVNQKVSELCSKF